MIENKEFFVYSVGANCVRPLGHAVNRACEHSSPLQKQSIELTFILKGKYLIMIQDFQTEQEQKFHQRIPEVQRRSSQKIQ